MAKVAIHPEGTKIPTVPLTHGIRKGNILQVAGQVAVDPTTNERVGAGDVTEQTRQVMRNVRNVLAAGGATFDDVVMCRVHLTDVAHFAEMNDAYREFFEGSFPARTTVYVGLPEGLLVEIDALAVLE
ncbi:RidA family protein [Actinophytocola sp.]|uniref:RidA family protein n=1 Tax=Actinophytocola sp. TaxID=1872138 RepID=UPI00389ABD90